MSPNATKLVAVLLAISLIAVIGASPVASSSVDFAQDAQNAIAVPSDSGGQWAQQEGNETGEQTEANVTEAQIEDHQENDSSPRGVSVTEINVPAQIESGEGLHAEIDVDNSGGEEEVAVVSMEIRNADTDRIHYAQSQIFYLAEGGHASEDYTVSNATLPPGDYTIAFETVKGGEVDVRSLNVTSG